MNSSIVGNMKRKKPSIPNIFDFCKLAEALNLSLDYLLLDKTNNQNITHFDTNMPTTFENNFNNQISVDEHNLIEIYREIDSIGKNQIQNNLRETWLEHKAMKKDASSGLISENKIG